MAQGVIYPGEGSVCTWEKGEIHCFGMECPIYISSVLVWRILGTGKPGGLPSMGSHRVTHGAFISALIFKISFLLLTLGFFISSFSSCFRCRVRLFIWLFSCFLRYAYIPMNLPLSTSFTVSHRFWIVVFSFSFVSMHILIFFLFLLWFVGYSVACCTVSICWNF